jgi:hypothetical protein
MLRVAIVPDPGVGSAESHLHCSMWNSVFKERP